MTTKTSRIHIIIDENLKVELKQAVAKKRTTITNALLKMIKKYVSRTL